MVNDDRKKPCDALEMQEGDEEKQHGPLQKKEAEAFVQSISPLHPIPIPAHTYYRHFHSHLNFFERLVFETLLDSRSVQSILQISGLTSFSDKLLPMALPDDLLLLLYIQHPFLHMKLLLILLINLNLSF